MASDAVALTMLRGLLDFLFFIAPDALGGRKAVAVLVPYTALIALRMLNGGIQEGAAKIDVHEP